MALLKRLTEEEILESFTHRGFYAGIVPVYLCIEEGVDYNAGEKELLLLERNGIPAGSVLITQSLWRLLTIFFPRLPPIYVTGEIE